MFKFYTVLTTIYSFQVFCKIEVYLIAIKNDRNINRNIQCNKYKLDKMLMNVLQCHLNLLFLSVANNIETYFVSILIMC